MKLDLLTFLIVSGEQIARYSEKLSYSSYTQTLDKVILRTRDMLQLPNILMNRKLCSRTLNRFLIEANLCVLYFLTFLVIFFCALSYKSL